VARPESNDEQSSVRISQHAPAQVPQSCALPHR